MGEEAPDEAAGAFGHGKLTDKPEMQPGSAFDDSHEELPKSTPQARCL